MHTWELERMNVLKPEKRAAMTTLLNKNVSQREISRNTGIDRKTIRKYIRQNDLGLPANQKSPDRSGLATGLTNEPESKSPHPGHRLIHLSQNRFRFMHDLPATPIGHGLRNRSVWAGMPCPFTRIWWKDSILTINTTA